MMTPVGRLIMVRSIDKRRLSNAMAPGAGRTDLRTAARRLHHDLCVVALDLLDQCADWARRHGSGVALYSEYPHRAARPVRLCFLLSGCAIGGLAFGLFAMGLDFLPPSAGAPLLCGGAISAAACLMHARRTPAPILDLNLLRLPTFRASIFGGFLFRLGIGALPFLLPLLLQIGFHLTPFQSGLITFTA